MSTSNSDPVIEQLSAAFPRVPFRAVNPGIPALVVPGENLVDVCHYLKITPGLEFDYLASLTAIDYLDRIDVVYQIRSLKQKRDLTLRVEVDRDEAVAPSVTGVWRAADFQEREIFDLMGVVFTGHPNLKRILLYDEFDGHPLRKDWRLPAEPRVITS
ncbi:MAG TPA: NADH-quinone oxidoreductase subunit C [Chloroflexota bacterium]|nr:NADH-quinone oxidoreductase subunit C [Chloroflexota bacterium]